jgi:glutamine synthetase type III
MKSGFNPVLSAQPQTIFDVMSSLARALDAINLGQGFPDQDGCEDVRAFAAQSLMRDSNQYPPAPGLAELRVAGDKLETLVADDLWPLPTYREMLFIK